MTATKIGAAATLPPVSGSAPATSTPAMRAAMRQGRRRSTLIAFAFIAPYLIIFVVFRVFPALAGLALSLGNYTMARQIQFRGLDNFRRLFTDDLFWNALAVTGIYTAIGVPLGVGFSLLVAQLCTRSIRGLGLYRTLFFLPVVTSLVAAGIVWGWIFSADGPVNFAVTAVGLPAVPWLTSEQGVLPTLAIVGVWSGFGYHMLILLAGLLGIPTEIHEAASVDAATGWRHFWHITLPLLRPTLLVVVILSFVGSFQVFDLIYVMTGGGPVRASYSLVYLLYDQGFHYFDFGYASAAGVVLLVITLAVSLLQRRLFADAGDQG